MSDAVEIATSIVKDVLQATLAAGWAKGDELESEARAVARQLARIRSHRDASAAIQRVLASSFGNSVGVDERELDLAGRLLVLRLRGAGLLAAAVTLEGFTSEEVLALVSGDLRDLVFSGKPLVFTVGSAQVLGSFRIDHDRLIAELAHVDGGGEGGVLFLSGLVHKFATANGIGTIEWLVPGTDLRHTKYPIAHGSRTQRLHAVRPQRAPRPSAR